MMSYWPTKLGRIISSGRRKLRIGSDEPLKLRECVGNDNLQ
jgi:hypothetical protein